VISSTVKTLFKVSKKIWGGGITSVLTLEIEAFFFWMTKRLSSIMWQLITCGGLRISIQLTSVVDVLYIVLVTRAPHADALKLVWLKES
jgi:hypothetical protein